MSPSSIDAETRASGGPVEDPDHDDFQRVKFAQRIAETLIKRRSPKSIVVGLYGKWGEGKSSVLHFIKRTLVESPEVVVLNFNPWRFSDETQLLLNFFGELAKIIGENLLTKKQRAVKGLSSYVAPLVPSLSLGPVSADIGKSFEAILRMAQPEIDEQRVRIEQLIIESGKRVVVIIDDIDRLEKSQIQAVFRLVKLTADFNKTSYLLSFDDEMVARAIGEIFSPSADDSTGSRTLLAGQNFLEKIIQVPLRLPLARPDDLLEFCWSRLNEAFSETDTTLNASDRERLEEALRATVLPRLTTPRLAVRFANAVQFGLPLLQGEVNTVDQILVEAMHIFYPQLHRLVATHGSDFVGSFQFNLPGREGGTDESRIESIKKALNAYEGDGYYAGLFLLRTLFPVIDSLFSGGVPWMNSAKITEEALTKRKSVAAPSHFHRYFAYSVDRYDIPDSEFEAFLNIPSARQFAAAAPFITLLGTTRFLQKVQYRVEDFTPEQATSMWGVIARMSFGFTGAAGGMNPWLVNSQKHDAGKLMLSLLFRIRTAEERRNLIESLAASRGTFDFAKELQHQLRLQRQNEEGQGGDIETAEESVTYPLTLFSLEEWQTLMDEVLPQRLLDWALAEAGSTPLYKSHPFYAFNLLFITWPVSNRQPDVVTYIHDLLAKSPNDIHDLVAICSSSMSVEGKNFHTNVTTHKVAIVTNLFGSYLYKEVRKALGDEPVPEYPGNEQDHEQPTPENRLRQFIFLYEHPVSNPSSEVVRD